MQYLFLPIVGGVFCNMVFWTFPATSFQSTDMDAVGKQAQAALGSGFRAQNTNRQRVDLTCASCAVPTMVSITIGQQTDGTDARVRSGQTTKSDFERLCQAREPSCRVTRADMGPAVGWVIVYRTSDTFAGSTLVLIRDGNLMTLRLIAPTHEVARVNVQQLQRAVLPEVVGH